MRVMMPMLATTYGESVTWTPYRVSGPPTGPIANGTTYIVLPRIVPLNRPCSVSRIVAGGTQWLVGPASSSRREQMKVRDSTRATSLGSERAR